MPKEEKKIATLNVQKKILHLLKSPLPTPHHFYNGPSPGGGYFRNFWVGMCHLDPGTL